MTDRRSPSAPSVQPVVSVQQLRKTYGRTVAVEIVSFEVSEGEIFGLIGPNGAGKTTTMECLAGLRSPDRGAIAVLGLDPAARDSNLQATAQVLPFTYATSLLRGVWHGEGWGAHLVDATALAVIFLVCTVVSARVFHWE